MSDGELDGGEALAEMFSNVNIVAEAHGYEERATEADDGVRAAAHPGMGSDYGKSDSDSDSDSDSGSGSDMEEMASAALVDVVKEATEYVSGTTAAAESAESAEGETSSSAKFATPDKMAAVRRRLQEMKTMASARASEDADQLTLAAESTSDPAVAAVLMHAAKLQSSAKLQNAAQNRSMRQRPVANGPNVPKAVAVAAAAAVQRMSVTDFIQ